MTTAIGTDKAKPNLPGAVKKRLVNKCWKTWMKVVIKLPQKSKNDMLSRKLRRVKGCRLTQSRLKNSRKHHQQSLSKAMPRPSRKKAQRIDHTLPSQVSCKEIKACENEYHLKQQAGITIAKLG
jgi:hypothetical protein